MSGYAAAQNPILYVASSCPSDPPPATIANPPCLGAANRSPGQGAEEVMGVGLAAGQQVFVFVDDASATNVGSLFRIEVNRTVRETEQNGTPATAGAVACPVSGSVTPAGDADFFALGTPGAGRRVFAVSDGAAANDADQQMRITTSADTQEFDDDNNFAPFGSLSPNIAGTPLAAGPAFIRINNFSGTATAEPYRLYEVVQPALASAAAESEPNDTPGTASAAGVQLLPRLAGGAGPLGRRGPVSLHGPGRVR